MTFISIELRALKSAMDIVRGDQTPDHAKWGAANHFVRRYSEIANEYNATSPMKPAKVFDVSNLKSPNDMLWPNLKYIFEQVYLEVLTLEALVEKVEEYEPKSIYNLLVSGQEDAWNGSPIVLEESRCFREYTAPQLTRRYSSLDESAKSAVRRAPCIFAYERSIKRDPKFGYLTDITKRGNKYTIEYAIIEQNKFVSHNQLEQFSFDLDIHKMELYRTHWAIKEVDLAKELKPFGILLDVSNRDTTNAIDIANYSFDVALSFPGEARKLVERVAQDLESALGPNSYFYDNNYVAQLAQPSLDKLLQGIYQRSRLIVAFIGEDYQKKEWCGLEFRAIQEVIFERKGNKIMYVRLDNGKVEGILKTDGYVDANNHSPQKIAEFIQQRLDLLKRAQP